MTTIKKKNINYNIFKNNNSSNTSKTTSSPKIEQASNTLNNIIDEVVDFAEDIGEEIIDPISKKEVSETLSEFIADGINPSSIKKIERHGPDMEVTMKDGIIYRLREETKDEWTLEAISYEGSEFEYTNGNQGFLKNGQSKKYRNDFEFGSPERIESVYTIDGKLIINAVTDDGLHNKYSFNTADGSVEIDSYSYNSEGYYNMHKTYKADSSGVLTIVDHIEGTETKSFAGKSFINENSTVMKIPYFVDNPNVEPENPFVVTLQDDTEKEYKVVTNLNTGKKDYYMWGDTASDDNRNIHHQSDEVCVATYDPNTNQTTYHYREIEEFTEYPYPDTIQYRNVEYDRTYQGGPDLDYAGEYGTGRNIRKYNR